MLIAGVGGGGGISGGRTDAGGRNPGSPERLRLLHAVGSGPGPTA
jgi:hypothetical protein